ncbi:MAG: Asp-tRNA(Asn)/Glu-tRNA(Gln) amidotransferase subunit GatC [Alphaproteobacteria bacterium]|nr:Asp-tRNA(Asn)/Glu-tRNA(Gln) amidotransferase subunit GatC [Alphaproteobacteria bacterium]
MILSPVEVKKIGKLARIKITDEECPQISAQLSSIMNWIDQLTSIDVSSVEVHEEEDKPAMHERADVVTDSDIVDAIMKNAPVSQFNMFAVPKVVE